MVVHKVHLSKKVPYLRQHNHYSCDLYNLDFVLESFGMKKQGRKFIRQGFPNFKYKATIHIFTEPARFVTAELEKVGFKGSHGFLDKKSNKQKSLFLRKQINKNQPTILRIGSGYVGSARKSFFSPRAFIVQHFVTVLGYDDKNKDFLIYDSNIAPKSVDKELSVGNFVMSEERLLWCWSVGLLWKPNFYFTIKHH